MTADDQVPGRWSDYCPAHAELCERFDRDFGPFPGCAACPKPADFDLKTQPHLLAAAEAEK